jgi:hypothetical protein
MIERRQRIESTVACNLSTLFAHFAIRKAQTYHFAAERTTYGPSVGMSAGSLGCDLRSEEWPWIKLCAETDRLAPALYEVG